MKLHVIGSNQTQISLANGSEILFSYNQPVAAFIPGRGYIRTTKKWSKTTSKHINAWITAEAQPVEQSELDVIAQL